MAEARPLAAPTEGAPGPVGILPRVGRGVHEEALALVTAEHDEADHPPRVGAEQHVHWASEADLLETHRKQQQLDGGPRPHGRHAS